VKEDDVVDRIIEQWRVERPDLDPSAKAVTGRIVRAADLVARRNQAAFAPWGIKGGEYSALSALRRSGAPYELSPSQMHEHLMVTSGGLSLMLDRLERAGLVRRRPHPDDRRSVLVSLTDEGLRTIDGAMTAHATVEQEIVAGLSAREVTQLATLLAKLLRTNEEAGPS
jgi:DNA-binding MarR family transcriptional regulator